MPPIDRWKYTKDVESMLITPNMFAAPSSSQAMELAGPGEDLYLTVVTDPAFNAGVVALGTIPIASVPELKSIVDGLRVVAGATAQERARAMSSAIAIGHGAYDVKKAGEGAAAAVLALPSGALLAAALSSQGEYVPQTTADDVERAKAAWQLLSNAQVDAASMRYLGQLMARDPMPPGLPVDRDVTAVRVAAVAGQLLGEAVLPPANVLGAGGHDCGCGGTCGGCGGGGGHEHDSHDDADGGCVDGSCTPYVRDDDEAEDEASDEYRARAEDDEDDYPDRLVDVAAESYE